MAGSEPRHPRSELVRLLRAWFGVRAPVGRGFYVASGLFLMALKLGVDAAVVYAATGRLFSPDEYLSPLLADRTFAPRNSWVTGWMVLWALPFLWLGISLSVRRALDAGLSPWLGLAFVLPVLNYLLILVLAALPTRHAAGFAAPREPRVDDWLASMLKSFAAAGAIAVAMVLLAIHVFGSYGIALFLATPTAMGAVSAYVHNRPHPRSGRSSLGVALASVLLAALALLLFALEGLVCVAMALPLAIAAALFGAIIGWQVANQGPRSAHGFVMLLAVPTVSGLEVTLPASPLYEVATAVEIDAPPERVWPHVIGFPDLPPPDDRLLPPGIAYPVRARIQGAGVGAVRYCEFSTGAFVEPITRWDPPRVLSFDVTSQPPPLVEQSLYTGVTPPHLDGYLRSRRGEFRLISLEGGRTRLEGSTWYELDVTPRSYFRLWADLLIHRIHLRVLRHVQALAERGGDVG